MATYDDITIDKVDFDWIKQCDKVSYLRKAVKVIEADGDYYTELKDACYQRMEEIDPRLKKKVFDNRVSQETKTELLKEIDDWEQSLNSKQKASVPVTEEEPINAEQYFAKSQELSKEQKQRLAENERNKGNESVKSKDFDEAIGYYTRSIELDPTMAASYCNRALAYLKKKGSMVCNVDFQKALVDCEEAIQLNSKYIKAYHRKGKAYQGLSTVCLTAENNEMAYKSFKEALVLEPDNKEINGELKELRESLTPEELERVDRPSALLAPNQFKRIVIEE